MLPRNLERAIIWAFDSLDLPITFLPGRYPWLPDPHAYRPFLRPWRADRAFLDLYPLVREHTTLTEERCYNVYQFAREALKRPGLVLECGVYRGGTALLLSKLCAQTPDRLHLFDTFEGMPVSDPRYDRYKVGSFADTSLASVKRLVGGAASFHPGFIPGTFAELPPGEISFAHVDVDQHESVGACIAEIFPRLACGGTILFDDYGFPGCYGARRAVDEYLTGRAEKAVVFSTGQAMVQRF